MSSRVRALVNIYEGGRARDEQPPDEKKVCMGRPRQYLSNPTPRRGGCFTISDFEIGRPIGRGQFGKVYSARIKENRFIVALKVLFKSQFVKYGKEMTLKREIELQGKLDHPNILKLYGYFWDEKRIYMVLEYAEKGELYAKLHKQKDRRFSPQRTGAFIYQIADALQYCHAMNIIHRDIKPENLLIDSNNQIKIADFGCSVSADKRRQTLCGTMDYLAPEIVRMRYTGEEEDQMDSEEGDDEISRGYGHEADVWAIGVLCYELLYGEPPFSSDDSTKTYEQIGNVKYYFHHPIGWRARDLISRILQKNPTKRLTLQQIKDHDWVQAMLRGEKEIE